MGVVSKHSEDNGFEKSKHLTILYHKKNVYSEDILPEGTGWLSRLRLARIVKIACLSKVLVFHRKYYRLQGRRKHFEAAGAATRKGHIFND